MKNNKILYGLFFLLIFLPFLVNGQEKCDCDEKKIKDIGIDHLTRLICLDSIDKALLIYGNASNDFFLKYPLAAHLQSANYHYNNFLQDSIRRGNNIAEKLNSEKQFKNAVDAFYILDSLINAPVCPKKYKYELKWFKISKPCIKKAKDNTKKYITGGSRYKTLDLDTLIIIKYDTVWYRLPEVKQRPAKDVKDTSTSVIFQFDKFELDKKYTDSLDAFIRYYHRHCDDCKIIIQGFTDDPGSLEYNQKLSENRVKTVRLYLKEHGIPDTVIQTEAFGKLGVGEYNKRKVELILYRKK